MNLSDLKENTVTSLILIFLVAIFVFEALSGGSSNTTTLIRLGAQNNVLIVNYGQWYRLVTAQFLHIGILHLACNMVMIAYLGPYLERIMGHWRFLALYLLTGIFGNVMSLAFANDYSISAGASTAVFGLLGAMSIIGYRNRDNQAGLLLGRQAFSLAVVNIVFNLFMPDIDIWGHIGGFIGGVLIAMVLGSRVLKRYDRWYRALAFGVLMALLVFFLKKGLVIG
ncbi:MAG: rhomboid family intramembrane serine protease [Lactobacillus sp.]|nr:rhomboid family intramembrane serine protease [Lactobacillus sp.]